MEDQYLIDSACRIASHITKIPEIEYTNIAMQHYGKERHSINFIVGWVIGFHEAEQRAIEASLKG